MAILHRRLNQASFRGRSVAAACLALALLTACGGGGGGGDTDPGGPPPTDTVTGAVTFQGHPLQGAKVLLYSCNENYFAQTATTDAQGGYSFPGLCASGDAPSEWLFWVMMDGYGFQPSVGSGAKVVRAGCNNFLAGYNTDGVGLNVTGIDYFSLTNQSLSGADFTAYDNTSQPLVHIAQTGQATIAVPGDDASKLAGVAWPSPRFTDTGDGTVTDLLTGLVWLKNAATFAPATWNSALSEISLLADGNHGLSDGSRAGDWRLPNLNELDSLVDVSRSQPALPAGSPFTGVPTGASAVYWSSTPYYGFGNGTTNAWCIDFSDGSYLDGAPALMATADNGVWAVRGTGATGQVQLQATGYILPVTPGDDGNLQTGVPFPYPRFIENSNGTVTDLLTGLVWLMQADAIEGSWPDAVAAVNALATGAHGLSDGSAAGDWRMPSRNEMLSLCDRMQAPEADFFDNVFRYASDNSVYEPAVFSGFQLAQSYWTSTTYAPDTTRAWTVYSCDYGALPLAKAGNCYTLAVR